MYLLASGIVGLFDVCMSEYAPRVGWELGAGCFPPCYSYPRYVDIYLAFLCPYAKICFGFSVSQHSEHGNPTEKASVHDEESRSAMGVVLIHDVGWRNGRFIVYK